MMLRALIVFGMAIAGACTAPGVAPHQTSSAGPTHACESLSRTACMQSTECTLDQEVERSNRYRCRPATEPCERGFAQAGFWGSGTEGVSASKAQQAECNARSGCGFVDGGCYCPCRGMGQT